MRGCFSILEDGSACTVKQGLEDMGTCQMLVSSSVACVLPGQQLKVCSPYQCLASMIRRQLESEHVKMLDFTLA
jgi:hypothetical protein